MMPKARNDWPAIISGFRASHDLTRREFADALNVSLRSVERWEAGDFIPANERMIGLALFGLAVEYSTDDTHALLAER